jgi:CHAD domain-containing protein
MSIPSSAGTELELKYRATARESAERLLSAGSIGPFAATGNVRPAQHEDVYVDTADGSLGRAGYAVRLRRAGGRTIVTLKSKTNLADGALHQREEIEGPTDGGLDPHAWPASAARSLVLELAGDAPFVELITVRQLRRRRNLVDGEATVELSVDDVDVVANGRVVDSFTEVEFELIAGERTALDPLAELLAGEDGLRPADGSKLEAALSSAAAAAADRIVAVDQGAPAQADIGEHDGAPGPVPVMAVPVIERGETEPPGATEPRAEETPAPSPPVPKPHVQRAPGVERDDTLADAGRKVLRFHFERMLARESGTRSGEDPEDLHAMRVATRRMRAAWRIFGDAYRPERTKRFRAATRTVARRLGAVRDLDVLIDGLDRYRASHPAEAAHLAPLAKAWRDRREAARLVLIDELDSARHARFVEDFAVFVGRDGTAAAEVAPTQPHRIRDTAPARIWAAHGDVRAFADVLRWADLETLHELRIAGKWLRYSLEFVREALGPAVEPLIERVVALQDHLGLMNDAHVSAGIARAFLVDHGSHISADEIAAIGRYLVDQEREAARLRRTAGRPFRAVAGPAFRHALGRLVAGL